MTWVSLTSEDWVKLLGQIIGPTLAAAITGGLLVYQSRRNDRRERERHERELAEARRRECLRARDQWVAIFQEHIAITARHLSQGLFNRELWVADSGLVADAQQEKDFVRWDNHAIRVQVATSRLLLVEQDREVRTSSGAQPPLQHRREAGR